MSKIRNLPESTVLAASDLVYVVDVSEGPNAGRKATVQTLKTAVIANAGEIPYDNTNSTLVADDVREALDELDTKHNDHSARHSPDGVDGLAVAAPVTANADGNNNIGTANSYSRSDHKHNITTAAAVTQTPDQANAAGSSSSIARADHVHNIPTDAPTTPLSPATTDSEGVGNSFARNDHTHSIATGVVGEMASIEPDDTASAGIVDKFARIDHQHAISTDTAITLTPDGGNTEGVSTSFARADHQHDVPAAAPTATLAPSSTNTEGSGTSFARNDHTHAHAMGLDADVSTILPNDAAATGATDKFARAGHKHGIATAAAVSVSTSTSNAEGNATSFARSNHTHAVSLASTEATTTSNDTTTSLTDVLMVGMTLTPAAGTYLIVFGGSVLNSANGAERTWVSMYVGGSQLSGCERSIGTAGGAYVPVSLQCIATVNGSQAIEIHWRAAGGTSTVRTRKLAIVKLA